MKHRKAKIIMHMQYVKTEHYKGKIKKTKKNKKFFTTGSKMFDYYDREEACDKTYCDEEDAFNYYNFRVGSNGAFSRNGRIGKKDYFDLYDKYKPETVYRMVVSFDKLFAIENNFIEKNEMMKLITKSMDKALRSMDFDPDNIEWTAWYHTNTDNPHCHITFYEKKCTRKRDTIPKKKFNKMKSTVISTLNINTELYINRDRIKKELFEKIENSGLSKNSKKLSIACTNHSKKDCFKKSREMKTFTDKLQHLNDILPYDGSMRINTKNIEPYRDDIISLVEMIKTHPDIKDIYQEYMDQLDKENQLYRNQYGMVKGADKNPKLQEEHEKKIKGDKIKKVDDQIANMILGTIKSYRQYEGEELNLAGIKKSNKREYNSFKRRNFKARSKVLHYFAGRSYVEESVNISNGAYAMQSLQRQAEDMLKFSRS